MVIIDLVYIIAIIKTSSITIGKTMENKREFAGVRKCFKCLMPSAGFEWTVIIKAEHNVTKKTKTLRIICGPCFGIKSYEKEANPY